MTTESTTALTLDRMFGTLATIVSSVVILDEDVRFDLFRVHAQDSNGFFMKSSGFDGPLVVSDFF